ncbi:hypothetical protein [Streptomyces sp. H27-D2]|uniref:hypothetical protein n=1 Tax=Streptomyces sp. H27-D2 TaxID=3046304 RepID=UPI002DBF5DB7|nr:hypothetical protein [Streptomyces sp. H27-D2]MEC4015938.1 hypothetical protein [Streptomyces sp. H27-D2]
MADDRYSWLDEDVAECLLRGEPVDGPGLAGAERLSAALRAASAASAAPLPAVDSAGGPAGRDARGPDGRTGSCRPDASVCAGDLVGAGELPGEAGALAAFRTARAEQSRAGRRFARAEERVRGIGRPFRVGFAVVLAGCALGGVAVAAGTGVLPTPFTHRGGDPGPASSVSVAGSPGPSASKQGPDDEPPPAEPSRSPSGSAGPDSDRDDEQDQDRDTAGGAPGASASPDGGKHDDGDAGRDWDKGDGPSWGGADKAKRRQLVLELCRAYPTGTYEDGSSVEPKAKRRLERLAGGSDGVRRFCGRVAGGGGGSADSGGGSGGDGGHGDGGHLPGGGDGGGDSGGSGGSGSGGSGGSGGSAPASPTASATALPPSGTPAAPATHGVTRVTHAGHATALC